MRFDDMLATALAQPVSDDTERVAKWRQLVDLIAQSRFAARMPELEDAMAWLRSQRDEIDPATRTAIARSVAGRHVAPQLLAFFGEDEPSVAMPLIATAQLSVEEWLRLLPSMNDKARALLRQRRDLDPEVARALTALAPRDAVLPVSFVIREMPKPAAAEEAPVALFEKGDRHIRELVARIEEFRKHQRPLAQDTAPRHDGDGESFHWEAGPDGIVHWVEGAPRGPLVGLTIATIAGGSACGVDGQAAGAFEKRAPFRDARLTVSGTGVVSGEWRISGVPFFNPTQGSFLGYRGTARRPRLDEVARSRPPQAPGLFGTDLPAESLRQLVHELRTPLNAIVGFAEMIDGQFLGPAGADYRSRAREIIDRATTLLGAVDDLDVAARVETDHFVLTESAADAASLLVQLHAGYDTVANRHGASVALEIEPSLPAARVEPQTLERMFARLFAATIGLARAGETIAARLDVAPLGGREMLCLSIDRPQAIDGLDEAALLDPGYSPEGDWPAAPALGLGFALRLVRNLAEATGGTLAIGDRRFSLYLPQVEVAEATAG